MGWQKKELEAKPQVYRAKREAKDKADEDELAMMISNMKMEQIARSKKWKEDDQARLNQLEADLNAWISRSFSTTSLSAGV